MQRILPSLIYLLRNAERHYFYGSEKGLREEWLKPASDVPLEKSFSLVPDMKTVKSILIYKADEIGDCVYALPALAELRRAFPRTKISVACQPLTAPIFERTGLVNEIHSLKVDMRFRRFPKVEGLEKLSADLAIFLRNHPGHFQQFKKISAKALYHPRDPRMKSQSPYQVYLGSYGERGEHQVLQMMRLIAPLTGNADALKNISFPEWEWTEEEKNNVEDILPNGPFLVVHPYSKDETRRWSTDYWNEIYKRLKEFSLPIVSIGSKNDKIAASTMGMIHTEGKLQLAETAYLISRAQGFVGGLSGPAHLAASFGVPTAVVAGGGDPYPREWGPFGNKTVLFRKDLPCSPCNLKTCRLGHLKCVTELTPDAVWTGLRQFLQTNAVKASL